MLHASLARGGKKDAEHSEQAIWTRASGCRVKTYGLGFMAATGQIPHVCGLMLKSS